MAIRAGGDDNRPVTQPGVSLYDRIRPPADQRTVRRLPALVARAVRLVRHAGGRVFWASVAVQLLAGGVVTAQVLAARLVLDQVIEADRSGDGVGAVAPALLLLVGLTAVLGLSGAAIALSAVPLAIAWAATGLLLGRRQERLAAAQS